MKKKIRHIKQNGDYNCGQTALAMMASTTIDKAIKAIGHNKGTTYKDIKKGLDKFGIKYDPSIRRCNKKIPLPESCLVRLDFYDGVEYTYSHWILKHKNKYYDPAEDKAGLAIYPEYYVRAVTYLKINIS